jgi:hypothetical protein
MGGLGEVVPRYPAFRAALVAGGCLKVKQTSTSACVRERTLAQLIPRKPSGYLVMPWCRGCEGGSSRYLPLCPVQVRHTTSSTSREVQSGLSAQYERWRCAYYRACQGAGTCHVEKDGWRRADTHGYSPQRSLIVHRIGREGPGLQRRWEPTAEGADSAGVLCVRGMLSFPICTPFPVSS